MYDCIAYAWDQITNYRISGNNWFWEASSTCLNLRMRTSLRFLSNKFTKTPRTHILLILCCAESKNLSHFLKGLGLSKSKAILVFYFYS